MSNKVGLTLFAAGLLTATVVFATYAPSAAQERPAISTDFSAQQQQKHKGQQKKQKKAAPAARRTPQQVAPQRSAPRVAAPQRTAPRKATQPRASRAVTQPKATSRAIKQLKATRKVVAPAAAGRKVVSPAAAPQVVTPRGARTVTASRLRGVPAHSAGTIVIRGQNYSVRRSGHRVRHGSGWWTFVALSTLGAIAIGPNQYYPYAYISAPGPYCEGLTEDGCQLMWQEVETIEGGVVNQCVAYCPWQ